MIDTTACLGPAGQLDDSEEHGGVSAEELSDFLEETRLFFAGWVRNIEQVFNKEDADALNGAVRDAHSIKSLVAFARLDHLVQLCHILEEAIQDLPRREGGSYSALQSLILEATDLLDASFDALEAGGLGATLPAVDRVTEALVESVRGARFGVGDSEFRIEFAAGLRDALSPPARVALLAAMEEELPVFEVVRRLSADQALSLQWAAMAPGGMILARSLDVDDAFDGVLVRYLVLPEKDSEECPALPPDATSRSISYMRRRQSGRDPAALRLKIDAAAEETLRKAAAAGEEICIVTVEFPLDDPIRAGRSQHVFEELQRIGSLYLSAPALETLRAGEEHGAFRLVMGVRGGGAEIHSILARVAEDANCSVRSFVFTESEEDSGGKPRNPRSDKPGASAGASSLALKKALKGLDGIGRELLALRGALAAPAAPVSAMLERIGEHEQEVREHLMASLLVPGAYLFSGAERIARDVARKRGRSVRVVEKVAPDLRLPRELATALRDPIHHLVRNAVDHGIEDVTERCQRGKPSVGTIQLVLTRDAGDWLVEVEDDGRGVDQEALRAATGSTAADVDLTALMARAGVSTAKQVDEISGRGAGMGVVAAVAERLGGEVRVNSHRGAGTVIQIRIPFSPAEEIA